MDDYIKAQDDSVLRSLLETILKSVPDAMIVIDETGHIEAFSAAAEDLFGYTADDVRGQNVSVLMSTNDRQHHDQYIRNYLTTGERQIIGIGRVVTARLANGEERQVELKIGESRLQGRRMFTGYIRDITEQQATAHRLSAVQVELSNFTRLSAIGTMASAMAHELNQPLTAVSNYLEAARDLLSTPDAETIAVVRQALDAASLQSVRAGQIVRRLRDYVSRGELDLRPVDLTNVIEEVATLSKIGVSDPIPRIFKRIDEDVPPVLADRLQIKQVLLNLVKNAFEALEGTENPEVWVRLQHSDPEWVTVVVSDNGSGLADDVAENIFTPFNSTKPDGMGLGLSISHTIIEAHGGNLMLDPAHEGGACFVVKLKAADQKSCDV